MSEIENGKSNSYWNIYSKGLNKSGSMPLNKYYNNNLNYSSNNYPDNLKLPKIKNKTKTVENELERRKRIKNEILYDFYKKREKEKEKQRKHNVSEDKKNLKKYLPIKKDLAKIMGKLKYHVQKKISENNYKLNQSLNNLDRDFNNLRKMIVEKVDRLEIKQKYDFNNLNKYVEMQNRRIRNKSMDNLIENGQYFYYRNGFNNINNNFYSEKERQENLELQKRLNIIPNLLDNMINDLGQIQRKRKDEKLDFLNNLNYNLYDETN